MAGTEPASHGTDPKAASAWQGTLYSAYRLVGLEVRRPSRERKVPGSNPACAGIFSGSSHTSDLNIGTPVATLPGAWRYRSALGLVGPVSVYCDWVRWKIGSASSISVWQHVKLSEQIRP